MRSQDEQHDPMEPQGFRELRLLSEVDSSPEITQRQLAQRLGVALGLTNVLMRNLVKKGYVKVGQATWKRRLYTLTPEGFTHRLRLGLAYVDRFLHHFRAVRLTLREQLEPLVLHEEARVALFGTGEFAELVYLGLRELNIDEITIFDAQIEIDQRFLGMPVLDVGRINSDLYDKVLIADLNGSDAAHSRLAELGVEVDKLVTFFSDRRKVRAG